MSRAVQLAAKFLNARDNIARCFPEKWRQIIGPYEAMIRRVMAHAELNAVEAFVDLIPSIKATVKDPTEEGWVTFAMMAAVAEIAEPTP